MDTKNHTIIIGLLALIVGLLVGYFFGASAMPRHSGFFNESMYEEMDEHMGGYYDDDVVGNDGELTHLMDEMMRIGRGRSGDAYEEAWLRGMIAHHLGAMRMSEQLLEETDRPELSTFANSIMASQGAEIEQMKEWLRLWFSEN